MAKINLLPWRDERREQQKKVFIATLFFVSIIAVGLILLADATLFGIRSVHQSKLDVLENEMRMLEARIKEIEDLKKSRAELIRRIRTVQSLQGDREITTRVFEELALAIPDRVYLTSIKFQGNKLALNGMAENNDLISELMENIDRSEWFTTARFGGTKLQGNHDNGMRDFVINTEQTRPETHEGESQ